MTEYAENLKEFLERYDLLFSFETYLESQDMSLEDYGIEI